MTKRALLRGTFTLVLALAIGLGLVGTSASPASAHDAVATVHRNGFTVGEQQVYNNHTTITSCDTSDDGTRRSRGT